MFLILLIYKFCLPSVQNLAIDMSHFENDERVKNEELQKGA